MLINTGNISRKVLSKVLRSFVKNFERLQLYLFEGEIKLRQIYELLKDSPWNVEYWEEAEVLEVELPEAGSVDFEDLEGTLGDEESDAWLQEQQIHTVFAVTIRPDDYELAKKVMEHIVSLVDGYFCADNENLQPRIPAKEAEQTTVES